MSAERGRRAFARLALLAGAAGSLALMLRAAARQRSIVLILLFTGWVLSPFIVLSLANLRAAGWAPRTRRALDAAMIGVSGLCLAVYGYNAAARSMKAGFVYLVVPAGAWVVIAVTLAAVALARRR